MYFSKSRPNVHHNQIKIIGEISHAWQNVLSESERDYYINFAVEARKEYDQQQMEFRASGSYKPSTRFEKLHGDGPWIKKNVNEKNTLEREISSYETIKFPPRPLDVEKPEWEQKIESQKAREAERRKIRHSKAKKREEVEERMLINASRERTKRIQSIPIRSNTIADTNAENDC